MKFLTGFFFSVLFISGCHPTEPIGELTLLWKDDQAIGLSIPSSLLRDTDTKKIDTEVTVQLEGDTLSTRIFGEYTAEGNSVIFKPLIPFSRGLTYIVKVKETQIGSIKIPLVVTSDSPSVLNLYPTADTLPENVLKMYITFSKPMKEGEALKQITLVSDAGDTVATPFLDLQPELWNEEGTVLTLWFDPGRVKRDLQPNKLLGPPLQIGNRYTLTISSNWKDVRGAALLSNFTKTILASSRDTLLPDPGAWKLGAPLSGTKEALNITLNEPLDYLLLQSAVRIVDGNGTEIGGKIELRKNETELLFIPHNTWTKGSYTVQIENRLEDLAGNNLDRPFDRDLEKRKSNPVRKINAIKFVIK